MHYFVIWYFLFGFLNTTTSEKTAFSHRNFITEILTDKVATVLSPKDWQKKIVTKVIDYNQYENLSPLYRKFDD